MRGSGWIEAQLNKAEQLLSESSLLLERNIYVRYPVDLPARARASTYVEELGLYLRERLYDFCLFDNSIIQFKWNGNDVSFCYYQSPIETQSYKDFLADILDHDPAQIEMAGDSFIEEYDLSLATARLREAVTPIRYDLDRDAYEEGVHPAAHIHIGTGNEIRILTKREMQPLSFVLFVIRQMYPSYWREFINTEEAPAICRLVREDLQEIAAEHLKEKDLFQLVLE